jgi:hypothetical protein
MSQRSTHSQLSKAAPVPPSARRIIHDEGDPVVQECSDLLTQTQKDSFSKFASKNIVPENVARQAIGFASIATKFGGGKHWKITHDYLKSEGQMSPSTNLTHLKYAVQKVLVIFILF